MKKCILTLVLVSVSLSGYTLDQFRAYADSVPEVVHVPESSFSLNPDYSKVYAQQKPSLIRRFLEKIGIIQPTWSPGIFSSLLESLTTDRVRRGLDKPHSLFLVPRAGTRLILVGPLYGSFHSLIRILDELQRMNLLDNGLKLTQEDTVLVFLGDVPYGSSYLTETLSLLMVLRSNNHNKFAYLAGSMESNDTWRGYSLMKELPAKIGRHYEDKVSQFFGTLAQALFVQSPTGPNDCIRIGQQVWCVKPDLVPVQKLVNCPASDTPMQGVKTSIISENRMMWYSQHGGLVLAPAQEGTLTWALFSAPNSTYRRHYGFSYDAFAILTMGTTVVSSVISLYHRDSAKQKNFVHAGRFAVRTGKRLEETAFECNTHENPYSPTPEMVKKIEACNLVSDKVYSDREQQYKKQESLYIGCTLDLTKGASPLGRKSRDGITLCINEVNAKGGIAGRPIKMVFMDDEYSPEKARQNVEQFIAHHEYPLFLGNLGSPTLEAYSDLAKQKKLFLFFPDTGAPLFRAADIPGIIHWRASFRTEAEVMMRYMIDTFRSDSFAFLYQDDVYGKGALEGAYAVIKKMGFKKVTAVKYERNTTQFGQQIKAIKDSGASTLGFFATSIASMEFIRQMGAEYFIGRKLFGLSDLAEQSFKVFARQVGLDMVIAQFVPNPTTSSLQVVKDYRKALKKQGALFPDVFTLQGYISASLAVHILKKAAPDFSVDSINKVIATLHGDYKGLPLSYDPSKRELAQLLWLDTGSGEWIKQDYGEVA